MRNPLIDNLCRPTAHTGSVDRVDLIETHISWILLAGSMAYKIKKPLNLGFLDFSELERRRFYCDEEVRLNRRTAPDLYLDTIPITGTVERPILNGPGDPLEYAVRMRRFDSRHGFDRMLERNALTPDHLIDLARALADLHAAADPAGPDADYGHFDQIADPMRDNFDALAEAFPRAGQELARLREWTESQLEAQRTRIDKRRTDGFVRECHGDAHLGNVTLFEGRATLFDCIEFSPELRWIDTACDLAFTLMDLHYRSAAALAWTLLDAYLARTGDFDGLCLLPLYTVYRAMVRAKIQGLSLAQTDDAQRRRSLDREIEAYIDLACRLASDRRPGIAIMMGLSGSGKSWLAERLVPSLGAIRVRSDVERKRLHGLAPRSRADSDTAADLYSSASTENTYAALARAAESAVEAGFPVLLDATFIDRRQRARFRALAARLGVPFAIVHCTAPDATLSERLETRARIGNDPSDAGPDVLARQRVRLDPLERRECRFAVEVDTRSPGAVQAAASRLNAMLEPRGGAESQD